ncbi:hypothetical protein ACLB2K_035130 [Fragaria x ananassa]
MFHRHHCASGSFRRLARSFYSSLVSNYSCCCLVDMVGEALNVLVLQDLKEQKWSKITVPLKFLKDDPILKDQIQPVLATTFDELQLNNAVRNVVLVYDMKQEIVKATYTKSTEQRIAFVKPSLVTLKGMEKED